MPRTRGKDGGMQAEARTRADGSVMATRKALKVNSFSFIRVHGLFGFVWRNCRIECESDPWTWARCGRPVTASRRAARTFLRSVPADPASSKSEYHLRASIASHSKP